MRHSLGLAMLLTGMLMGPSVAQASTKCVCDNGKVMTTQSDADDACQTSCDLFGGGRPWSPDDENSGSGSGDSQSNASGGSDDGHSATAKPPRSHGAPASMTP